MSGVGILSEETLHFAQILWDYHHLEGPLGKSDCIVSLGSYDLRVAHGWADLYLNDRLGRKGEFPDYLYPMRR